MTDTMSDTTEALRLLLKRYAQPDPSIIAPVRKGGDLLDAVGHAEVTRILIEEDPLWEWEPQAWSPEGGPLILRETCYLPVKRGEDPLSRPVDMLMLWGRITIHGKTRPCVGTCEAGKPEAHKELISDLLRNGAMRFGIALNLWSKAEKGEADYQAAEFQSADFFGWPSQGEHDAWWDVQKARLLKLTETARDSAVEALGAAGLFDGRKPKLPFHAVRRDEVESLISVGERNAVLTAPLVPLREREARAIEVLADALGIDDPQNPPEGVTIEPWMWDLAEVEDLDAHKWETTLRASKVKRADLLDRAFHVAERLGVPTPHGINDIYGPVAREVRVSLLKGETF